MVTNQVYWHPFVPSPHFGRSGLEGNIKVEAGPDSEAVTVLLFQPEGVIASWSAAEFVQLKHDLGEAATKFRALVAGPRPEGNWQSQFGRWLTMWHSKERVCCNLVNDSGVTVTQFREEAAIVGVLQSLPTIDAAIEDALATFRRSRQ